MAVVSFCIFWLGVDDSISFVALGMLLQLSVNESREALHVY